MDALAEPSTKRIPLLLAADLPGNGKQRSLQRLDAQRAQRFPKLRDRSDDGLLCAATRLAGLALGRDESLPGTIKHQPTCCSLDLCQKGGARYDAAPVSE
jgi:hypothetical protein